MGVIRNFLLAILTLSVAVSTSQAEPRVISCEKSVDLIHQDKECLMNNQTLIDSQGFTIAPQEKSVKELSFNTNKKIAFLPVDVYKSFTNLTFYGAASCSLKTVSKENFKQLYTVIHLHLQDNQIEKIHSDTFSDLFSLSYLKLNDNKIKFMNGDLMIGLTRLKTFFIGPKDCFNSVDVDEFFMVDMKLLPSTITAKCGFDETEYFARQIKPTDREQLERNELIALFETEFQEKDKARRKAFRGFPRW